MSIENSRELLNVVSQIMAECNVECFADSGTLLGIIRGGDLLSHDSDIDLGILRCDEQRVAMLEQKCLERDILVKKKLYKGKLQGVNLEWADKRPSLDIHAHCYYRHGDFWCSPQIVKFARSIFWPHGTWYVEAARKHTDKLLEREGALDLNDLSVSKLASVAGEGSIRFFNNKVARFLYRAYYKAWARRRFRAIPTRREADRFDVVSHPDARRHWASYTWVVPAKYFNSVKSHSFLGCTVNVPERSSEYLALRYGSDWQTPNSNWIYFISDGLLYAAPYEAVAPRLDSVS